MEFEADGQTHRAEKCIKSLGNRCFPLQMQEPCDQRVTGLHTVSRPVLFRIGKTGQTQPYRLVQLLHHPLKHHNHAAVNYKYHPCFCLVTYDSCISFIVLTCLIVTVLHMRRRLVNRNVRQELLTLDLSSWGSLGPRIIWLKWAKMIRATIICFSWSAPVASCFVRFFSTVVNQ